MTYGAQPDYDPKAGDRPSDTETPAPKETDEEYIRRRWREIAVAEGRQPP